jgi:hypothetical protein
MSYSRWGNSYWYTFWDSKTDSFEICGVTNIGYFSLKKDIDECIRHLKYRLEEIDKKNTLIRLPTEIEYQELKSYMLQFINDFEEEYRKDDLKDG